MKQLNTELSTEKGKIADEPLLVTVIIRLLGFPFFLGLAMVYSIILLVKYCYNYVLHGGEAIFYTRKNQRHMIEDVYQELVKMNQKE
jgi:hypothetical protein